LWLANNLTKKIGGEKTLIKNYFTIEIEGKDIWLTVNKINGINIIENAGLNLI